MTGTAEWQFALFALAIGLSDVAAGLVATVPLALGALLQLVTPWGVRRLGSIRRWVWMCAAIQAMSLLPLVIGAFLGGMPWWVLYATTCLYWAAGYATAPPWQAWFTSLVPGSIRARYTASRNRFVQGGLAAGILAGLFLQVGEEGGVAAPRLRGALPRVVPLQVVLRGVSCASVGSGSGTRPTHRSTDTGCRAQALRRPSNATAPLLHAGLLPERLHDGAVLRSLPARGTRVRILADHDDPLPDDRDQGARAPCGRSIRQATWSRPPALDRCPGDDTPPRALARFGFLLVPAFLAGPDGNGVGVLGDGHLPVDLRHHSRGATHPGP